ncbi:hypothetical protein ACFXOS_07250 [Streptomyces sp. NPDC059175]|uniref:hypothetical protein n=1 Tax=Streptomyces sp. NPDC059175 TaxID=3346757 RepID=UPI0036AA5482
MHPDAPTADGTNRGTLAGSGRREERLWLLGGVAVALTAAGIIAVVATRDRRNHH